MHREHRRTIKRLGAEPNADPSAPGCQRLGGREPREAAPRFSGLPASVNLVGLGAAPVCPRLRRAINRQDSGVALPLYSPHHRCANDALAFARYIAAVGE